MPRKIKDHCSQGHLWTPETITHKRICATCNREGVAACRERQAARKAAEKKSAAVTASA